MSRPPQESDNVSATRQGHGSDGSATPGATQVRNALQQSTRDSSSVRPSQGAELKDYQLGDCLGKGAFGSVFRALNMSTGETVAVKQIKLADLPKSELRVITLEIDLLKNLDHPNIVKYHGFVKSSDSLNIILEYCENGSLHSISKNFGKFPENLVGFYMAQILQGLLYLHEQGVIHRDIKGANILTTKQGLVKLADFGVATKATNLSESTVVGTPYWMAPEVIELSGATTGSDIWSLGCTVIELLDGKPPYHKLQPMHALFRIVNDEHPPLPEGASPVVRDFLLQCFQKDPNLRVSARKLLRHPWIANSRKSEAVIPNEEAVKSVQQWNEALRSPNSSVRKIARPNVPESKIARREKASSQPTPPRSKVPPNKAATKPEHLRSASQNAEDIWDDDFSTSISSDALKLPHLKPTDHFGGMLSAEKLKAFASIGTVAEESNWNDDFEGELTVKSPLQAAEADPLKTVRPHSSHRVNPHDIKSRGPVRSPARKVSRTLPASATRHSLASSKTELPKPSLPRPTYHFREDETEDYTDLILANDGAFDSLVGLNRKRESTATQLFHPSDLIQHVRPRQNQKLGGSMRRQPPKARMSSMRRTRSSVEIQRYAEDEHDEDFSQLFEKGRHHVVKPDSEKGSDCGTLMLTSKFSNNSWLGDEDDEDDPFAELEERFDEMDLEANVARDKYARLCTQVEGLVGSLKDSQAGDTLAEISEQLLEILIDSPDTKSVVISAHGMLPILEILESCRQRDIIFSLLKIVNLIVYNDVETQESLCFIGGIPIITKFTSRKFSSETRLEAAAFVRQMCQSSTLTLQMFVSAGGLKVLVEFLEEDYEEERDLVLIGVNGVWSVFELQGPTPKNDFCRILSKNSVLDPLSLVLSRVLDEQGELAKLCEGRIANIFLLFSQAESHVKEIVAERTVLHRVLKELKRMSPTCQIIMLKFIKNLSMLSTTLEKMENSNAIDVLTELLKTSMDKPHFREMSNQILNTIYNLCRLNKKRQEDAALNDIIPTLMKIYHSDRPLKEFSIPILCDMAHSGKVGRRELLRNKGLKFYISLLTEPSWQVNGLDAIFAWLQEETAKVEENLLELNFTEAMIKCFNTTKANSFENLLEPLQKLQRLSPPVALTLAHPDFFARVLSKLSSAKALTRLNLLRIVQSICDATDEQGALINVFGLYDSIQRLAESDPAILVRDLAGKIIRSCEEFDRIGKSGGKRRPARRASSSRTPPSLLIASSIPPTPTSHRSSMAYHLDRDPRRASVMNNPIPFRPVVNERDRDREYFDSPAATPTARTPNTKRTAAGAGGTVSVTAAPAKSRLPRTTASGRTSRQSLLYTSPKTETGAANSSPAGGGTSVIMVPNSRRRRQVNGTGEGESGK